MLENTIKEMITAAKGVLKNSYAPYSNYNVAAAVLMDSGKIYTGVNVENAAYTSGICAERNAIFSAIAAGEHRALAVAIVASKDAAKTGVINEYATPCGHCRQALREFCNPKEMLVISAISEDDYRTKTLEELLPESFGPENLLNI